MKSLKQKANSVSIEDYLLKLGYHPRRASSNKLFYYSPLQQETKPSFCVYTNTNSWYDFGRDVGGYLVQLVQQLCNCEENIAINKILGGDFIKINPDEIKHKKVLPGIKIVSISEINNSRLLDYLWARNINPKLAGIYCKEIAFTYPFSKKPQRVYLGIGIKNKKGGWYIRTVRQKTSVPPAYFSEFSGSNILFLYEGAMNMLSFLSYFGYKRIKGSIIVLNAWSNVKYVDFKKYRKVYLFLDNDERKNDQPTPGEKILKYVEESKVEYEDHSGLYKGYNDFNSFFTDGKY